MPHLRGASLRWAPFFIILLLTVPVCAGLIGTLAPALGWYPSLGGQSLSLAPAKALLAWPGLKHSALLSATTGLVSTLIALGLCIWVVAAWQGTWLFRLIERMLSPLLSVPHAAAAFGLAFLIAPSGWIARALSPWATGWTRPPDVLIVQDPLGLALIAGLVVKELPFLLLMTLAALAQVDANRSRLVAQPLGYGRIVGWLKTTFPAVYAQIRLPVYAVLVYGITVIDMAVILGPTRPATLSVQIATWVSDPDLSLRFQAAAGALLQLMIVILALVLWRLGERAVAHLGRAWAQSGRRGRRGDSVARGIGLGLAGLGGSTVLFGLIGLAIWSFAGLWRFPDALPSTFRLTTWMRAADGLWSATVETMVIGAVATVLALGAVMTCLESESRHNVRMTTRALFILYLPLLVPQIAFLPGLQSLALLTGLEGGRASVVLAHVLFVFPYVFLSLADPWRSFRRTDILSAAVLGAGPNRVLFAVRLPLMLRAVLTAAAVGFAVSVGQYLPTLLIGGGRVETLTTEAVALASGGNRRVIGVYALAQILSPLLAFSLAPLVLALLYRKRLGMAVNR